MILLVAGYYLTRPLWEPERNPDPVGNYNDQLPYDLTCENNGQKYRQRGEVTTLLLMGIDHDSDDTPVTSFRNGGQTDIPGAYIMPVTKTVSSSLSLLNSDRLKELLQSLGDYYDYVIIDAPPIGALIILRFPGDRFMG